MKNPSSKNSVELRVHLLWAVRGSLSRGAEQEGWGESTMLLLCFEYKPCWTQATVSGATFGAFCCGGYGSIRRANPPVAFAALSFRTAFILWYQSALEW